MSVGTRPTVEMNVLQLLKVSTAGLALGTLQRLLELPAQSESYSHFGTTIFL